MTSDVTTVINTALQSIEQMQLPCELQDRIDKHKENLSSLAASLLAGGIDIEQVRATVTVVLDGFKEELMRTLIALRENDNAV
jgi:hypothetical protein